MSRLDGFWLQLEKGQVVRRLAFFGMMWMTYVTYMWAMGYIDGIETLSADHALLIGAILGPVSALQGAIIKFYAENPYKPNLMMEMENDKDEK